MALVRGFLRVYGWIFETILCLLAVGVAVISALSHSELEIGWLPWTGKALLTWMILLGLLGLVLVGFAVVGRLRALLFLFSVGVLILLAKGLFVSNYSFPEPENWKGALLLLFGALVAAIGTWPVSSTRRFRGGRRNV